MTLSLGTHIGHYTVIEHVGAEGTTAEVYRAQDERLDRVVALKLLAGTNEPSRREARAVTALSHPNIVATFDVIEYDGKLCLVQEWINGGSLANDLGVADQLSVQETVRLGRDVASADSGCCCTAACTAACPMKWRARTCSWLIAARGRRSAYRRRHYENCSSAAWPSIQRSARNPQRRC